VTRANTLVRRALFAYAPASAADGVLSLLNDYRVANGLAPLAVAGDATAKAQSHSDEMAAAGSLFHSADLASGIQPGWSMLGENVGAGSTADQLQSMFEASSEHRANMLNPAYDQVGIGVAFSPDGRIWITQFFVAR
jgi:uncharacterized protein YkwD